MKLTEIQIDRCGVWQNVALPVKAEGVSVFFGPNESGKTALRHFIRGVLFGFSELSESDRGHAFFDGQPAVGSLTIDAELMAAAYPGSAPPVWKDPRACLLLPFWREVLPGPLTAVFVWRDPLAVARSLHARDGMPVGYGLALWEWYIRSAAAGLAGVDTYVLEYAAVVADPEAALAYPG